MKGSKAICVAFITAAALLPAHAFAVDGVILIDQNKALAGNVTPGDAPGFPVTITQPGSYRLSGNLTVPNSNTDAIEIAADFVTIDLNGFSILGPVNCAGGLDPCAGRGQGRGIWTGPTGAHFNITIQNGTIQGMGSDGINLFGEALRVSHMNVSSNGDRGILISTTEDARSSVVEHCNVQRNGATGIWLDRGRVSYNTVSVNGQGGIFITGNGVGLGSVLYNVVTRNFGSGLAFFTGARGNYIGNVFDGNQFLIQGGVNQGQNLCNGVSCPGAVF